MRWVELQVVAIALVLAAALPAQADPDVYLEVKLPADRGQAPRVVATVVGGPAGTTPTQWSLAQVDRKPPAVVQASGLRAYRETNQPIAIVVLLEGHMMFIGNTSYEEDPDSRYEGVLRHLEPVLRALRETMPPGSLGAAVTYDKGARVNKEMGPLADLDGRAFGLELDYSGHVTRDLVTGVNESITQLRKVASARKALVVITDGADTSPENARTQLAQLRRLCAQDQIELYGIAYTAAIGDEMTAITSLIPEIRRADSLEGVPQQGLAIADQISDRYEIDFPGNGLVWDGCEHELQLQLDGAPFGDSLFMSPGPFDPCRPARRRAPSSWPFILAGVGVGAAGMGLVLFLMRRRRRSLHR